MQEMEMLAIMGVTVSAKTGVKWDHTFYYKPMAYIYLQYY